MKGGHRHHLRISQDKIRAICIEPHVPRKQHIQRDAIAGGDGVASIAFLHYIPYIARTGRARISWSRRGNGRVERGARRRHVPRLGGLDAVPKPGDEIAAALIDRWVDQGEESEVNAVLEGNDLAIIPARDLIVLAAVRCRPKRQSACRRGGRDRGIDACLGWRYASYGRCIVQDTARD